MLEKLGYTVTSMTDSTTALERFKSAPNDFDLVITDMSMPRMSGDQLASGSPYGFTTMILKEFKKKHWKWVPPIKR
jgi:hypothetical protein